MQDAKRLFDMETLSRTLARAIALIAAAAIAGCGGGSGASTEINPATGAPNVGTYNGPAPATADVQAFKLNVWDNISPNNRCGSCHSVEGGQTPMFARSDDINLAYAEAAQPITNLQSPVDSRLVVRVASGHNCWLTDNAACGDIMTTWITNWAGDLVAGGGRQIELKAPLSIRDPGASRHFPADPSAFQSTVYPVLQANCSSCHSSNSAVQQSPFFAEGPLGDPGALTTAYEAAKSKIDLDSPDQSRMVIRLRDESHNCWTLCANDAVTMQTAIEAMQTAVGPPTPVDPLLVTSKALTLYEGTIASGGNRYESSVIANYEFKTGSGTTAFDTSGVDPAMDLTITGSVEWFGGWGLNFSGGKAQASTASSTKLQTMIGATGEYSIEAWVAPGNVVQEDTRIVSYSGGPMARNFNLGQTMYNYDYFNVTDQSDENGNPRLATPDAAEVLQATLQHVVVTFDPVEGRKIYVNGVLVQDQDPAPGGSLAPWDDTFAFVIGNEVDGLIPWMGVVRLVAIHNRALTQTQITQNFDAGVGEKFFLLFSVEHLTSVPESYVVFQAAQFDTYAYVFNNPFFISLDGTAMPGNLDLEGMRIVVNGQEMPVGQSYAKLDMALTDALYDPATGQPLSNIGAVLPLELGPDSDEFFLTFDVLAGNSFNRPPPITPPAPTPQDLAPASDIGMKTFDEINASFSEITGVSKDEPNVLATYVSVKQSLPTVETIEAFLASHQTAVSQLAVYYCNALVNTPAARNAMWPAFPWGSPVNVAFPGGQSALIDPLLDRVLGTMANPITIQPARAAVTTELDQLLNGIPGDPSRPGLIADDPTGNAARTDTIARAVCAAGLGNSALLMQ